MDDATPVVHEQWWLAGLGTLLVWARLREHESGTAEVLDHDGRVHVYDSADTARSMLMDAEFRALDGLDEDDAAQLGVDLGSLQPPQGGSAEELRERMSQRLPGRQ